MRTVVNVVWVTVLSGCIFGPAQEVEGDEPFECEDGADNDQDGDFDCDDEGCEDSPECEDIDDDPPFADDDDYYYGDDDTFPGTTYLTVWANWLDDGQVPTDIDGDSLPDVGCGDSVTVQISDPFGETDWRFGMAETGSSWGWFGEDCYVGYANFNFCHRVGFNTTIPEVTSCSVFDVMDGRTLMDSSKDPFLTYYLEDSMGNCFVWGHDPTYYGPLNCAVLN